jgi:hypothetical protein
MRTYEPGASKSAGRMCTHRLCYKHDERADGTGDVLEPWFSIRNGQRQEQ